jgi:hypothetical protein
MFCISETIADREKLVPFLESAGQIYPEMSLTFEAPKCVLPSVICVCGSILILWPRAVMVGPRPRVILTLPLGKSKSDKPLK